MIEKIPSHIVVGCLQRDPSLSAWIQERYINPIEGIAGAALCIEFRSRLEGEAYSFFREEWPKVQEKKAEIFVAKSFFDGGYSIPRISPQVAAVLVEGLESVLKQMMSEQKNKED